VGWAWMEKRKEKFSRQQMLAMIHQLEQHELIWWSKATNNFRIFFFLSVFYVYRLFYGYYIKTLKTVEDFFFNTFLCVLFHSLGDLCLIKRKETSATRIRLRLFTPASRD
jgi:hypothetical protein